MINKYYQQQLSLLRSLGSEFSKKHPSLAPMLAGQNSDPDVERILEGVAFLTASIQQRLDDDFPEFIHGLTQLLFPHYLRPLPSTTIVRFKPKPGLKELCHVKSGTELATQEKDGLKCKFTTCADLDIQPLKLDSISPEVTHLTINFKMLDTSVSVIQSNHLRIFLGGSYVEASDNLLFINENLAGIELLCNDERNYLDRKQAIKLMAESDDNNLFRYPKNVNKAFKGVQEFFTLPQYQLFIDLLGVDWLQEPRFSKATEFAIKLKWKEPQPYKRFNLENFDLFCVPAVNLFEHHAESIWLDHHSSEYRVAPAGGDEYQVYSVESVVGFEQGSAKQRDYQPFTMFNPQGEKVPVYSIRRKPSVIREGADLYLSVAYADSIEHIKRESLSIKVTCTNGTSADKLKFGDICMPTDSSPVLAEFTNIIKPTAAVESPLGDNLLWRMLSHLYINQVSLAERENLIALLKLYIYTESKDKSKTLANTKRVEAIVSISSKPIVRLCEGMLVRGNEIVISLDPDGFSSRGDMYLFGCVINKLLSAYSSINSFTQLVILETGTGYRMSWHQEVGLRCLV